MVNISEFRLIVPLSSSGQWQPPCSIAKLGNANIYLSDTKKKGGIEIMPKLYLVWISLLHDRPDEENLSPQVCL